MDANKIPTELRNWHFRPNLRTLAIRTMLWQVARSQGTDEFLNECKATEVAEQVPQYFCFDSTLKQLTCSDTSRPHQNISGLNSVKDIVARSNDIGLSREELIEQLSEYSCLFDLAKLPVELEILKTCSDKEIALLQKVGTGNLHFLSLIHI